MQSGQTSPSRSIAYLLILFIFNRVVSMSLSIDDIGKTQVHFHIILLKFLLLFFYPLLVFFYFFSFLLQSSSLPTPSSGLFFKVALPSFFNIFLLIVKFKSFKISILSRRQLFKITPRMQLQVDES